MNQNQKRQRPQKSATIWDLPARLFHVGLILTVSSLLITGFLAPEWWLPIHLQLGYGLVFLMSFRLIWGFVGSQYSRYQSLNLKFSALKHWLLTCFQENQEPDIGHNPPGSWMILVFLVLLILMIITGILLQGSENLEGPAAAITDYSQSKLLIDIHNFLAWSLLAAIVFHLAAVVYHDLVLKHGLIKAMVTGMKQVPSTLKPIISAKPFGLIVAIVTGIIVTAAIALPDSTNSLRWYDIRQTAQYETFASECGDCHFLYHPSMNSETQWLALLNSLENHYGEDASLSAQSLNQIKQFFIENNETHFDTQVSVEIGQNSSDSNRISNRGFWKARHHSLDEDLFNSTPVNSPANCESCHQDAETGLFQDQKIQLPEIEDKPAIMRSSL